MDYPNEWYEHHATNIVVMDHFGQEKYCPKFEKRWNKWTPEFKFLFYSLVIAVHNARFDWFGTHTAGGDLRIGFKNSDHKKGRVLASVKLSSNGYPMLEWKYPAEVGREKVCQIDMPLVRSFSQSQFLENLRNSASSHGILLREPGEEAYWPDQYMEPEEDGGDETREDEDNQFDPLVKLNMNSILYGPPGTGKTHSVTALALSILSVPDQRSKYNAAAILRGKPPLGQKDEWQQRVGEFNSYVKQGRIEVTTFHQNYSYEDFVEGLKASAVTKEGRSSVVYEYESGILKRVAYRALYAWMTGHAPLAAELSESELGVVQYWLKNGEMPVTATTHRVANTIAPPFILIIDEINRGNVARIFGELITLVEGSKRARLESEIEIGHQPLAATLPYTKEALILPPNLYIIGTMNTADRSLVGLDAALRRRFEFIELAPQPELLKPIGNVGEQVDLCKLLTELNKRIADAEGSTDHEIGHAYFLGVKDIDDLATVMARQVIPQLREYFFDQSSKIHVILAPVGRISSPFIDDRGKTVVAALRDAGHYRRLYGAP